MLYPHTIPDWEEFTAWAKKRFGVEPDRGAIEMDLKWKEERKKRK